MKKKAAAILLTTAMAMTMFAGCGSSDGGSSSAGGSAEAGKPTLSIFVYGNEQEQAIYNDMIAKFEEANDCVVEPQYSIKDDYGTTITGMMTAKELPDVFYCGPETVGQYAANGYIQPLGLGDLGLDTADLMQDILAAYTVDGELYALPHDASVFAYAYNKDLFDKEGIPYPDPEKPYTYDEFVEICKQFTKDTDGDGEIDQWGCGSANAFMMYQYIWSNGASFCSDDYKTVTIDTPEFKEALQKYIDLTLTYEVTPTVEQDASLGVYQRWLAGQEAFYACGTWDVAAFMDKETFPFNWDLCAYPTLSTGKSYTWLGTVGYCVSANSDNADLAKKLAYWMSADPDGNRTLSGISTGQSIQLPNLVSMADGEFVEAINDGKLPFPTNSSVFFDYMNGAGSYSGKFMETTYTPNAEWTDIFFSNIDMVKNGSMTIDEFVAQFQPEMQEALDNAWESIE